MIALGVDTLKQKRPEWSPWLALVDEALRQTKDARWEGALPEVHPSTARTSPVLAGAAVVVDGAAVYRLLRRLIDVAARSRTPKMATLQNLRPNDIDAAAIFRSSICGDFEGIAHLAAAAGADAEAFQAVVALVAMPFLHACNRRWGTQTPQGWIHGYCPVCASWPAFAEVRGIERSRHFRCGRCGGEWHARLLHCAYCGNHDHDELTTLVAETPAAGVIEACKRCGGYVKAFTRLQGCAPASVILEDLASVDLDVAALEHGFTRPSSPGAPLDVEITAAAAPRRRFAWNV